MDSTSGTNNPGDEVMVLSVDFTGVRGKNYKSVFSVTFYNSSGNGESAVKQTYKTCS